MAPFAKSWRRGEAHDRKQRRMELPGSQRVPRSRACHRRMGVRRPRAAYPNVDLSGWNDRQRSGANSPPLAQGADAVLPRCNWVVAGFGHFERLFCRVFLRVKASRQHAFLSNFPNLFFRKFWKGPGPPRSEVGRL